MIDLKKPVLDKIEKLGIKESAIYFGKSEGTIRGWQKTGVIPLSIVEKVMEEGGIEVPEVPKIAPVNAQHESEHEQIWTLLNSLNTRLAPIERFLQEHFPIGLDQPAPTEEMAQPSFIEPIPSRNVPPVITEATIRDNKPAGTRSPNASITTPIPTAPPVMNSIGGPGDWMRPRPLQPRQ